MTARKTIGIILVLLTGFLCWLSGWRTGGIDGVADPLSMADFQRGIGGVGMGAVMVPAWNFCDFDPRLQSHGFDTLYPVPAGYSYSPDRLSMVSSFRKDGK